MKKAKTPEQQLEAIRKRFTDFLDGTGPTWLTGIRVTDPADLLAMAEAYNTVKDRNGVLTMTALWLAWRHPQIAVMFLPLKTYQLAPPPADWAKYKNDVLVRMGWAEPEEMGQVIPLFPEKA